VSDSSTVSVSVSVSVCVITYNHEAFIAKAIESALRQKTAFDFEIVAGDDASTDATPRILAELERRHAPRLRVFSRPENLGVNRNLAATLQECRGKYIALLEGDDYWLDDGKLQLQHDFLEAHPDHAICFHPVRALHDDGERGHLLPRERVKARSTLRDLIERGNFIPTASVMFRNRVAEGFPDWFYDLRIGDFPLNVMNARHGDIGFIDRTMAVYRLHTGGTFSGGSAEARVREVVRMYEHVNGYLDHRFDRTIRGLQSYWQAVERFEDGDVSAARKLARVRFATPPTNRQRLMAGLMAFATPVYKLVRRMRD
jgi:glycosyltransferase involved in cell wall biosynthesis